MLNTKQCLEHNSPDYCYVAQDIARGYFAPDVNFALALRRVYDHLHQNYHADAANRWRKERQSGSFFHLRDHMYNIMDSDPLDRKIVLEQNLVNIACRALMMLQLFEESKKEDE